MKSSRIRDGFARHARRVRYPCILIAMALLASLAMAGSPLTDLNQSSFRDGYIAGKAKGMDEAVRGSEMLNAADLQALATVKFRDAKTQWREVYWVDGFMYGYWHGYKNFPDG